jgi:acyl carrier protein
MSKHDTVTGFLKERFRASLRNGELKPDEPLFSTGIVDSFGVLEVIAFLEDTFHIRIDTAEHELLEFDSVDKIVALVEQAQRPA